MKRVYSGAPWERKVGYCRALRRGELIFVTGTAPVSPDGTVHSPGDARAQTARCLEIIEAALRELGATKSNIVRTRMFVTDIGRWEEYGAAHAAFFGEEHPTTTMVQVVRLIDPQMLIEIEVDAIADSGC